MANFVLNAHILKIWKSLLKYCDWCNPTILANHWFVKFTVYYPTDFIWYEEYHTQWWPNVTESPLGVVFTTQYIQVPGMQQNTFHKPVACHLDITAPSARFRLFEWNKQCTLSCKVTHPLWISTHCIFSWWSSEKERLIVLATSCSLYTQ